MIRLIIVLAAFLAAISVWQGSDAEELSGELIVFHAGSLSVPFDEASKIFMKQHSKVRVVRESAGSRTCARKISDLNKPCDVMASADYTVINELLIPEHARWNIKFASNEMAIAYHENSRGASEINKKNWHEILMRERVVFGRSDPNADPCGYRTVLTAKLAEKFYGKTGLAEKLLKKDAAFIRPKETDLLALLEVNEIDYIFIYRSVAEQHGLKCVLLPDEINLKKPKLAETYSSVSVEVSGKKPGEKIVKRGRPMVYGVTIPSNAPNPKAAMAFVSFLLEKENGMAIMGKNGQPSVVPALSKSYESIPEDLKRFVLKPMEK
ncbi:tungstate ABC transporter substrate-binding protein WtpA [Candidatus Hydrogenedentota bacterium]